MKKLKNQYIKSDVATKIFGISVAHSYPLRRDVYYRRFSTKQEKSSAMMHLKEYSEHGLKIRSRRAGGLADPYDDYPSKLSALEKCWKNNSKRRHQWL